MGLRPPDFRLFYLGPVPKEADGLVFDEVFMEPQTRISFQKQLTPHLVLPERIRVLMIDDEEAVSHTLRDYLENCAKPSFEIHHTGDGRKGLSILEKGGFDVLVLDIKMPVLDGREVYREIKERGITTPVIIYFDAIFGDEMVEIHKYGRPAWFAQALLETLLPFKQLGIPYPYILFEGGYVFRFAAASDLRRASANYREWLLAKAFLLVPLRNHAVTRKGCTQNLRQTQGQVHESEADLSLSLPQILK